MTINGWTIALQAINFLVLVWLLQRFLYKPAMAMMARRKQLVEEAFDEARSAKTQAEAEQKRYQSEQEKLVASRDEVLARAHEEIEADRTKVLDDAHKQAAEERATALAEIKARVADLSVSMATRLLEQLATQTGNAPGLAEAGLAALLKHIDGLPEEERSSLDDDLGNSGEQLKAITAVKLGADSEQRWRAALEKRFPGAPDITFQTSPDLLGGAELRFPHAVVSLAWSEQLKQARAVLLNDEDAH
jgi:F-type H+-transporting ATPase subunit b